MNTSTDVHDDFPVGSKVQTKAADELIEAVVIDLELCDEIFEYELEIVGYRPAYCPRIIYRDETEITLIQ
ncbi:MAG: hypothetical protein AAFP77_19625 [Bacteroidota bacterium]